jgi:hypothetical protein
MSAAAGELGLEPGWVHGQKQLAMGEADAPISRVAPFHGAFDSSNRLLH